MLGHRCKNRQLYTISVQEEEELNKAVTDERRMKKVLELDESNPQVFLHVLEGTFNF